MSAKRSHLPGPMDRLFRIHPGWYAVLAALLLTLLGCFAIQTVRPEEGGKQLWFWLPVSVAAMLVCVLPHPRWIGRASYTVGVLVLLVLVFLIAPGVPRSLVPVRNGATSWIAFGSMTFQPSEIAKIVFVLAMAWYLRYRESYRTFLGLLIPFLIMFVPVALILKQPDLGTAMLFAPTLFAMLVAAGAKLRHLGTLAGIGVVVIAVNVAVIAMDPPHERSADGSGSLPQWVHVMKPHQEKRFAAMMWPKRYEQREAFQGITARRLIGAGGLSGLGYERAKTLIHYNRLPEPHNDMIFAVIVNRWGFIGGMVVVLLYVVLVASIGLTAARSKDPFIRLSMVGFAAIIFTQAAINIAMTLGLMPVTGITLPFVSYGGSSLIASWMMVGLTLNFAARRPQWLARPSFEYDNTEAIFQ